MTFAATSSPGASTAAGQSGSTPPICQNCTTSTTPLWRRDEAGSVLCNACGLFLKLHGRPRPISLKTDVIKSRNRVKNSAGSAGGRKKPSRSASPVQPYDPQLLIATPPRVEQPPTIESLVAANNKLKTRVAELELVNDLFRGRLGELENMESLLEAAGKREEELKRRIKVLEDGEQQRQRKKVRVADLTA